MKIKPPKIPLKSKIDSAAKQVEQSLQCKLSRKTKVEFLPTGSTLLNLAISNTTDGGWPRARVTNIVGDGSSGKCCRNCFVLIPGTGLIYIDDIGKELKYGETELKQNLVVEKSKIDKATHFWKERRNRIIKIETEHGFEHEITDDHKLKVLTGENDFEMIPAKNLEKGDILLLAKNTQVFSENLVKINDWIINEDMAEFLGIFAAVGVFERFDIEVITNRKHIIEELKILARKLDQNLSYSGMHLYFGDKYFIENMLSIFDSPDTFNFEQRFVPKCILQSPKKIQIKFIKALLESSSNRGNNFLEFWNSSKRLTKEIQLMLLNMGIVGLSGTDYSGYDYYYQVIITGNELKKLDQLFEGNFRENEKDLENNYFYDPIKNIAENYYTSGIDVFDFYIPNNHLFWGNGFINHNTVLAVEGCYQFLKNVQSIKSKIFPRVKKAKAIFNNGEAVMDFPVEKMFGEKFNCAVDWRRSKNIEAAGRDFLREAKSLKTGEALFYVMDSWDSFKSVNSPDIIDSKDEDVAKAYNFAKQIYAWKFFAQVCDIIEENKIDATLLVISQTRQKVGATFGKKKYRTGGDALNFYTHLVPWVREVDRIKKTKFGEERIISILSEAKIERTKVGLPFRSAQFSILFDYGIDDVKSMATYLKMKKYSEWKNIGLKDLHQFSVEVEKRNLIEELKLKVESLWHRVESEFEKELLQRLPKRL